MINAHSHIEYPEMKFWIRNEWKNNTWSDIDFTLLSYYQGIVFVMGDNHDYSCFCVTIFNFSFVLRIRKD